MNDQRAGDVCRGDRQSAKGGDVGVSEVSEDRDTLESSEEWRRSIASNRSDRCCEWDSRLKRGQKWISRVMSSEVKSRRAV